MTIYPKKLVNDCLVADKKQFIGLVHNVMAKLADTSNEGYKRKSNKGNHLI